MHLAVTLLCFLCWSVAVANGVPRQRVVVVHSYPPGEWFHSIQEELAQSARKTDLPIDFIPMVFHSEYWLRRPAWEVTTERERILNQIRALKAHAVVLCDDEAADVFSVRVTELAIPLFLTGINRELGKIQWWPQVKQSTSVVLERYPVQQLLQSARRMFVSARRVTLLSSKNPSSKIIVEQVSKEVERANSFLGRRPFRITETVLSDDWQQWKTVLATAHLRSDLVWVLVPYDVRDKQSVEISAQRIGQWMSKHLKVPSLGLSSVHPKMGVLLTVALTPQQLARATVLQLKNRTKSPSISLPSIRTERNGQIHLNLQTAENLNIKVPAEILSVSKLIPHPELPYGR
jgi:hypothetical protein